LVTGDGRQKQADPATTRSRSAAQEGNPLTKLGITTVDYKDTALLRTFISERGKIRSRRVTGLTVQQQRQVAMAIKNAREVALLPFAGP
jgi:small subunit ribosomal protein S18